MFSVLAGFELAVYAFAALTLSKSHVVLGGGGGEGGGGGDGAGGEGAGEATDGDGETAEH